MTAQRKFSEVSANAKPSENEDGFMARDALKACPFCGGDAERLDFETVGSALGEDPNAGGACIQCKQCGASSPVHFDRKENLDDSWNRRIGETAAKEVISAPSASESATPKQCDMGVGCDEAGVCYAAAHGEPERCPLFVPCPVCDGSAERLVYVRTDWTDGPLYNALPCPECEGTGRVETEGEPITLEDLESTP